MEKRIHEFVFVVHTLRRLLYCTVFMDGHVLIERKKKQKDGESERFMNREIGVQFDYELVYASFK